MKFIITFIALLIERFFDWSHIRRWQGFNRYVRWLSQRLSRWPNLLVLGLVVLPPVLLVASFNHFLCGWLYGLLKFIFGVLIVMYSLGPLNFWSAAYASFNATQQGNPVPSSNVAFGVTGSDSPAAFHRALTQALFRAAHNRVFAVLLWFVLLGPAGALLYRLIELSASPHTTLAPVATQILGWLDWLPVRLMTLLFALAGHFTHVLPHWKKGFMTKPAHNESLLSECGVAALDVLEAAVIPVDGKAETETVRLLDRVFVIGLVLLAIVVLV